MSHRTQLYDRFFIGSAPASDHGFDVVVLCAKEYQPPTENFRGKHVIRVPFDDSSQKPLTRYEAAAIGKVTDKIAALWREGKSILVTCVMGRNRSALVSTLALSKITGAPTSQVATHVRRTRRDALGVAALQNSYFWELLQHQQGPNTSRRR